MSKPEIRAFGWRRASGLVERRLRIAIVVVCWLGITAQVLFLGSPRPASAQLSQTVITGPPGSQAFGSSVRFLPNGNYVVADPSYDMAGAANVGAVHLYSGSDNSLIATLTGSSPHDSGGISIYTLLNGNYLVAWPSWDQPEPLVYDVGALTWCDGETGCSGIVSPANSAVGTSAGDFASNAPPYWNNLYTLANGNYVIRAWSWDDSTGSISDAGAVRFCDGDSGCVGPLTAVNSLVGSHAGDSVDSNLVPLPNGNYVVASPLWDSSSPSLQVNAGAVTFCSGTSGCTGTISASNSLVGTTAEDQVGEITSLLSDGSYVVHSGYWDNGGIVNAGAATWCNATTGCPPGPVTAANSLTGAAATNQIGGMLPATPLPGGAYVVASQAFDRPGGPSNAGAMTWCGPGGAGCTGATVTTANSLVGSVAGEFAWLTIAPAGAGAFAVGLSGWDDPGTLISNVGAAVFCNASSHCRGETPSAANALVGSTVDDNVGATITSLPNGNYVVGSSLWDDGGLYNVGAATFCSGTTGCQGPVTPANSYTGSLYGDMVGQFVYPLATGNYVVNSPSVDLGMPFGEGEGAVRFCSGTTGCNGTPSLANAFFGVYVTALQNGNYFVSTRLFDNGDARDVGALTYCDGSTGCSGAPTPFTSLIGSTSDSKVGGVIRTFADGSYVVVSRHSYPPDVPIDTVTYTFGFVNRAIELVGPIGPHNSMVGIGPTSGYYVAYDEPRARYAVPLSGGNRFAIVEQGVPEPGVAAGVLTGALAIACAHRRSGERTDA